MVKQYRNIFFILLLFHFLGWIASQFFFAPLGFGDQGVYLNNIVDSNTPDYLSNRTLLTTYVFNSLSVFAPGILSPLLVTSMVSLFTYLISFKYFPFLFFRYFWIVNLLPSFLIWMSIASKEALFFIPALVLVDISVDLASDSRLSFSKVFLVIFLLIFCVVMRLHYAIGYGYLVFSSILLFYRNSPFYNLRKILKSFSVQYLLFIFFSILFVVLLISLLVVDSDNIAVATYMLQFKYHFLTYTANTNRFDIPWDLFSDFVSNIFWGIPFSIIGFTPIEAIRNPKYLPFFIEGVISFMLFIFLLGALVQSISHDATFKAAVFLCFLPALVFVLLAHYPFGIFNPGSALRYKQSLVPIIYFYPLFMLALRRKNLYLGSSN